jgi:hypothetical protein
MLKTRVNAVNLKIFLPKMANSGGPILTVCSLDEHGTKKGVPSSLGNLNSARVRYF